MYAIQAVIHRTGLDKSKGFPDGWEASRPLPLFYLDERVQGIISAEQAERIAMDIVMPFGQTATMTANITAVRVPGEDYVTEDVAVSWTEDFRNKFGWSGTEFLVSDVVEVVQEAFTTWHEREATEAELNPLVIEVTSGPAYRNLADRLAERGNEIISEAAINVVAANLPEEENSDG